MNKIITIGREFGSGGRELGRRLARELGFDYYDKEILTEIAKHTSLSEEYVQQVVENQPRQLFPITVGRSFLYVDTQPLQQASTVFHAQQEIIREMAERSDCVIVGRCADYILRDKKPFRIFVYADMQSRIDRCRSRAAEGESMTDKEYKQQITSTPPWWNSWRGSSNEPFGGGGGLRLFFSFFPDDKGKGPCYTI